MGVNEIKQEIGEIEHSIELEQQELNKLRQQIIEEVKPFAKDQIKSEVENKVKYESEHTKELGRDALAAMKQRLFALLDNSDDLVEKVFDDDGLWIHINYDPGDERYAYFNQKNAEEQIYKGIKRILGEAGKILLDNGYIQVGYEYKWEGAARRNFNLVDDKPTQANLLYGKPISISKSIRSLIEEYKKRIEALHEAYFKVLDLKERLSRQEAVDLWDEV